MPAPFRSALLPALALLAAACRPGPGAAAARTGVDTVAIGVALNPERPGMEAIHQGVDLAVAALNADPAVRARGVAFVALRTPRGLTSAVRAAERLRDDPRVAGIVGDAESGRTLDALPVYEDADGEGRRAVVAVSPTATSGALAGRSPWLFRMSPSDETASRGVADFAFDSLHARRAAVVYRNDSYGRDWGASFARAYRAREGEAVARDPYVAGVTEWEPYAAYLATLAPDLVLFPGSAEDAGPFLRALRRAGLRVPVLGGDALAPLADSTGFDGVHFAVAFVADRAATPEAKAFVRDYGARFGGAPGVRAAMAYEAAMLVGRAAAAVGRDAPRRRREVRDWIAALGRTTPPLPGVAGPIAFDPQHSVLGRRGHAGRGARRPGGPPMTPMSEVEIPGWTLEHPTPAPVAAPPAPAAPAALRDDELTRRHGLRPRTIRGWLRAGFGANLILLAATGGVAIAGLQNSTGRATAAMAELRVHQDTVQQVGAAVLREIVAGSRYAETGDPAYLRRYQQAMEEADDLRRRAVAVHGLTVAERAQLEAMGSRQSATEARLAMVRAYRALGRSGDAERVLALAMEDVTRIGQDLAQLRAAAAARGAEREQAMTDALRTEEIRLAALLAAALAVAMFFAAATSGAVTRPLAALLEELGAGAAGDLRDAARRQRAAALQAP
ncbi:ABC transporter substrate-binding protein, partial [Roseisolibacter sp. H3M3-2]|uniref:ABC transporter substrate-binding protein n=1 Tax=Roseisolibacter sp. H3M3-2 TaxID=3031323 RepID=UPI0023DB8C4D